MSDSTLTLSRPAAAASDNPGSPQDGAAELAAAMFPTTVPCLTTVARLGVAAALDAGPRTIGDLAAQAGCDPEALTKVIAVLAAEGIFALSPDGTVAHTPRSEPLSPAHPRSLHDMALLIGEEWLWRCWGVLPDAVRTGAPAFALAFGESAWSWLPRHPDAGRVFHAAMAAFSRTVSDQLVAALPVLAGERVVCDLGGGTGTYLAAILRANTSVEHGIVLDAPDVVAQAQAHPVDPELSACGRLQFTAGNFLEQVPAADLYVAKQIIHSWTDDDVIALLRVVREANPRARVVIAEFVADASSPRFARDFDLTMFLTMPGAVRRAEDLERIVAAAGFELVGIHATASTLSLIEARPRGAE
ncbi:MAG: methyltransferase [Tetrasphaera sp.]